MTYINPIEILELQAIDMKSIDNSLIKKAKRRLFADIDLSDSGYLDYKGIKLTKTECDKVIDDLENPRSVEFYSHLATNRLLNDFLVNGNKKIFSTFKQESIYKFPEFVKFISPYFAPKFDRAIIEAFHDNDESSLMRILQTQSLITTADINIAFRSLSNEIQKRIEQVDEITEDVKNEESVYSDDNIDGVVELVETIFPVNLLLQLPYYFQSQINKIAESINFLQLALFYEFNNTFVSMRILEHLFKLNIESVAKPTFQKNYDIIKKKHKERIEQEKNAPVLKKYAEFIGYIQSLIQFVDNKTSTASYASEKVKTLISISDINNLPTFADEIRTQLGYSIRSLSISCWNSQNDVKSSLELINFALQISVDEDIKMQFHQDKNDIEELQRKYKGILVCYFCETNTPDDSSRITKTIYKVNQRSSFPSKVEYSYAEVSIPRCQNCKEQQERGRFIFYFLIVSFLILGVIVTSLTSDEYVILGGMIGSVIGLIIGKIAKRRHLSSNGIKDTSKVNLENHPLLIERVKEGWTFSQPSA